MDNPKRITVYTTQGAHQIFGRHMPEREKPNWHYYEDQDGTILHCRKEHMVCVIESDS